MPEQRENTVAHIRVKELLLSKGGKQVDIGDGKTYFVMPNDSVVRMPDGHGRVPESWVEWIAMEKIEMSVWEFDYWWGQQDKGNH